MIMVMGTRMNMHTIMAMTIATTTRTVTTMGMVFWPVGAPVAARRRLP